MASFDLTRRRDRNDSQFRVACARATINADDLQAANDSLVLFRLPINAVIAGVALNVTELTDGTNNPSAVYVGASEAEPSTNAARGNLISKTSGLTANSFDVGSAGTGWVPSQGVGHLIRLAVNWAANQKPTSGSAEVIVQYYDIEHATDKLPIN